MTPTLTLGEPQLSARAGERRTFALTCGRGRAAHEVPVENKWISSGELTVEAKMPWYLFGRRTQERGACRLVDTALSFRSFRAILYVRFWG